MADTVTVACPECGKKINVPEEILGRKIRCKGCDESFVARASRQAAKKPAGKKPEKQPEKKPEKKPAPAQKKAAEVDDEEGSDPYGMTEEYLGPRCPECANAMEEGQRVCVECGYDTVTRQRYEQRSVHDTTALDYFLWWLPGIACVLLVFGLIGFCIFYCIKIADIVGDPNESTSPWYSFIAHGSIKMWLCITAAAPCFYAAKFAFKRLVLNNQPPEVLTRGEE